MAPRERVAPSRAARDTVSRRTRTRLTVVAAALLLAGCGAAAGAGTAAPGQPSSGSGGINRPEHRDKPHLILVSLDGFKPEYLDRFHLPHIRRVAARGARASALIPVFPSLTFPSHYSLVTGLYPERHGIVSNTFYDPAFRETYSLSNRDAVTDAKWYRGEPIWVTAETQGMVSGCFFWPGSEAAIGGVRPAIWMQYDGSIANGDRVRTVLEWLALPAERRPHAITLYFSELDSASHAGPLDSPAVERAAKSLDRTIGTLVDGIRALPIRDRVYLLLTSDHGMTELTTEREVALARLIDTSDVEHAFGGPVASLHVRGGPAAARRIREALNARLQQGRAYLREELPQRFHYRADPRAGDVVVVMDEGWTLITGLQRVVRPFRGRRGMHGWDPALPSMHALFVAMGPGIRAGATIPQIDTVDVYPFMAELLGLRAAPDIDGRPRRIRDLVMQSASDLRHPEQRRLPASAAGPAAGRVSTDAR